VAVQAAENERVLDEGTMMQSEMFAESLTNLASELTTDAEAGNRAAAMARAFRQAASHDQVKTAQAWISPQIARVGEIVADPSGLKRLNRWAHILQKALDALEDYR
jgi:hypothetical protein